jgi:hypothetical protein
MDTIGVFPRLSAMRIVAADGTDFRTEEKTRYYIWFFLHPGIRAIRGYFSSSKVTMRTLLVRLRRIVGLVAMLTTAMPACMASMRQTDAQRQKSGLTGTTTMVVKSGLPGGDATKSLQSLEFAVAPIQDDMPIYKKAMIVKSDSKGHYAIALPPGPYWIGPKAKALDPEHYHPTTTFTEVTVVVKTGEVSRVDLVETAYAP